MFLIVLYRYHLAGTLFRINEYPKEILLGYPNYNKSGIHNKFKGWLIDHMAANIPGLSVKSIRDALDRDWLKSALNEIKVDGAKRIFSAYLLPTIRNRKTWNLDKIKF